MNIQYRPCVAADADLAVPLIYSSGPKAFRYVFSANSENQALAFLRANFVKGKGQFGYNNHTAIIANGTLVGVGAVWYKSDTLGFTITAMKDIFSYYGFVDAIKVSIRGLKIETAIKPPRKGVANVAHIAVAPNMQGKGLGARLIGFLLNKVKQDGILCAGLDVAESNSGAKMLYERLGFKDIEFNAGGMTAKYGSVEGHTYMELTIT